MNNHELATRVFIQLAVILLSIRIVGSYARYLGQPQVVGEMIAGVLIGPSLFGFFFPETQSLIFPPQTRPVLYCLAQLGIVLYMFTVGLEFNSELVSKKMKQASYISISGILAPMFFGGIFGYFLASMPSLFSPGLSPWNAALFTGAAMSITAFPMLARIIYERNLSETLMGTLALSAGAFDDAMAWCILAFVISSNQNDYSSALYAVGGGIVFASFCLLLVRKVLQKNMFRFSSGSSLNPKAFNSFLLMLMLAVWFTDYAGIYAVFGAFVLGVSIPRGVTSRRLQEHIEPITSNLLLPLFFVYSGLNTRLNLLIDVELIAFLFLAISIACMSKGVACFIAARLSGASAKDAVGIGALMNARGLMELILLNIGLEKGLITPTFFTIMVLMAILTTCMATPIFDYFHPRLKMTDRILSFETRLNTKTEDRAVNT